ncbi:MAG: hypothetical protein P4L27_11775 [Ignavibacteriaceae bacterium]|nr:hypothetical protein [Ignavibacteriaceae bacterium]
MKNIFKSVPIYLAAAFFIIDFNGCSSVPEVVSQRNINDITIDGNQQDWGNSIIPVKNDNVAVAFRNDGENLYICFITSDNQKIVKMMSLGFTIWLYPSNLKDVIGVEYPVKKTFEEMRLARQDNSTPEDVNGRIQHLLSIQKELIIVDENNIGIFSAYPDAEKGFKAKIGFSMNQLVYELKVPLEGNKDFSQMVFRGKPGDEIRVKFETGKPENIEKRGDEENGSETGGGGRRGSGMGGGRGSGMGRGGGGRGSGNSTEKDNSPLEYEFKVKLAGN